MKWYYDVCHRYSVSPCTSTVPAASFLHHVDNAKALQLKVEVLKSQVHQVRWFLVHDCVAYTTADTC